MCFSAGSVLCWTDLWNNLLETRLSLLWDFLVGFYMEKENTGLGSLCTAQSAKAIGGLDLGQIPLAKLYILPFPDGLPFSDSFQGITEFNV